MTALSTSGGPSRGLWIYPTAVALRQAQRREVDRSGFFDGRQCFTLAAFLSACADAAVCAGLLRDDRGCPLRPMTDLDRQLAIAEAVTRFRRSPPQYPPFRDLPASALEMILEDIVDAMAPLAGRAPELIACLARQRSSSKNPGLAALYRGYAVVCRDLGVADDATLNAAILALLQGERARWPEPLRQADRIVFLSVRAVAPFQESVIAALSAQLGGEHVHIRHILAEHEQDWWARDLMVRTGSLLFGEMAGAEDVDGLRFHVTATQQTIERLVSLREGYAMQDRALAEQASPCVGFSCSVGLYGEIEDLARRIAWELHDRPDPLRPEEICLVVRDLGVCSDAIMDVFSRFNLPYYFRRGVPLLSIPMVKVVLNFARFSAVRDREVFCALLESPLIDWPVQGIDPAQLADDILRSGAEPVLDDPLRLSRRLAGFYLKQRRAATRAEAEDCAALAGRFLSVAADTTGITTFADGLDSLLARCRFLRCLDDEDTNRPDALTRRARTLNTTAREVVIDTLTTLRRHALLGGTGVTWGLVVDLLKRAFENLTVVPGPSDESGVWILNPYDVGGLRFRLVLMAGMNAGEFPRPPTPSPLFSDGELATFRGELLRKGPLPAAALAPSRVRNSQENLLFLTSLAAARERIVFSYRRYGEDGRELTPSVFFSTLWRLVGWPAWSAMPELPPDPYDRWRLARDAPHLRAHWQQHTAVRRNAARALPVIEPHKRRPFPGESFLGTIPLTLCRAADECWQRLAYQPADSVSPMAPRSGDKLEPDVLALAQHVVHGIQVEHERQAFFDGWPETGAGKPLPSPTIRGKEYAGILSPAVWAGIRPSGADPVDLSPTQLERLVACPYQYYLQYVAGIEPIERNELEASARDVGTAIHKIMQTGFRLLQSERCPRDMPVLEGIARTYKDLVTPDWAVPTARGWRFHQGPERPSAEALPLVSLPVEKGDRVLSFFDALTEAILRWATSGDAFWMLGWPEQVPLQCRRIRRIVRNLVRTAIDPDAMPAMLYEGVDKVSLRRHPCLLEYAFDSRYAGTEDPSVELRDVADPAHVLRLHGKIDRVDLVFDERQILRAVIIVDYKGKSKSDLNPAALASEVVSALDCQLPAYAMAAARRLAVSAGESVIQGPYPYPILMQYLSYALSADDMIRQSRRNCLALDGRPLDAGTLDTVLGGKRSLLAAFTASAFAALGRYERGEFAVAPVRCAYCDFAGCCRHYASLLSAEPANGESAL